VGGNIDVNGGTFGAYATVFGSGFYLDTAVTGGPNGYDTHRSALQGSANGSTHGADVNVVVSAGYDWKRGNFSVGPTASFQFGYVGLDGFTELKDAVESPAVARPEARLAGRIEDRNGPVTIELDFEDPIWRIKGSFRALRHHWGNKRREVFLRHREGEPAESNDVGS
jgi:hypothetical protein